MRDSRDAITGILYAVAVSAVLWALLFSALARGQVRGEIGAGALAALAQAYADDFEAQLDTAAKLAAFGL